MSKLALGDIRYKHVYKASYIITHIGEDGYIGIKWIYNGKISAGWHYTNLMNDPFDKFYMTKVGQALANKG